MVIYTTMVLPASPKYCDDDDDEKNKNNNKRQSDHKTNVLFNIYINQMTTYMYIKICGWWWTLLMVHPVWFEVEYGRCVDVILIRCATSTSQCHYFMSAFIVMFLMIILCFVVSVLTPPLYLLCRSSMQPGAHVYTSLHHQLKFWLFSSYVWDR